MQVCYHAFPQFEKLILTHIAVGTSTGALDNVTNAAEADNAEIRPAVEQDIVPTLEVTSEQTDDEASIISSTDFPSTCITIS